MKPLAAQVSPQRVADMALPAEKVNVESSGPGEPFAPQITVSTADPATVVVAVTVSVAVAVAGSVTKTVSDSVTLVEIPCMEMSVAVGPTVDWIVSDETTVTVTVAVCVAGEVTMQEQTLLTLLGSCVTVSRFGAFLFAKLLFNVQVVVARYVVEVGTGLVVIVLYTSKVTVGSEA